MAAQTCPAGLVTLGATASDRAGKAQCELCPAEKECETAAAGASACPAGKVSALGSTICSDCPAGYSCPTADPTAIVACADGEYSTNG